MPTGNEVSKDIYWLLRITWKKCKKGHTSITSLPSFVSLDPICDQQVDSSPGTYKLPQMDKWKEADPVHSENQISYVQIFKNLPWNKFNLQWWKVLILYHSSRLYHIFRKHLTMCNGISETSFFKLNSNSENYSGYTQNLCYLSNVLWGWS